ncbi:hypothetical protein A6F68_00276 [Tsuneonella dongtanensis]|uniref:DUF2793 domain-containing protein n=1 Tax=Tsuneonella dongtanensis TaxID=692370 RepID=A0A1B2A9M2_9SPHN|nr:DUF2793 domain-containing protein [Tsuneonella dongtanensis]ANY18811.1 hypothetical protein A6F68_00276 [Tsuneonella dongtanensis]
MSEPFQFPYSTPRHDLPLLFAGQSQKDFFVNAALARCDALLHPAIEGETGSPPATAEDGVCWLVSGTASSDFAGKEGAIAFRQAGSWCFASPSDGMRIFDKSAGQYLIYFGGWRREPDVEPPSGGADVDDEARQAIAGLIGVLKRHGILPQN